VNPFSDLPLDWYETLEDWGKDQDDPKYGEWIAVTFPWHLLEVV
jgi:hypothetical protein